MISLYQKAAAYCKSVLRSGECANVITHGIGLVLAVVALVYVVLNVKPEFRIACLIYTITLVLLYLASTLYHSALSIALKSFLQKLDHIAIYLLIAGTYTPFCTIATGGWIGWTILSIVWTMAVAGVIFKAFFTGRYEVISLSLYIAMGWLAIIVIGPLYKSLSLNSFILLFAGGIVYSLGIIFYVSKKSHHHSIWHLFVIGGSTLHFLSILGVGILA